ncbi:hypothetical protein [Halovivax limisalsi]|uniref:hypothetical protein n=1 Tax=Halovivax limisalsi TaxID=1453760 RepID=UPI001FFD2455|nr:hypothetical protein [Halovivax limisalsi]
MKDFIEIAYVFEEQLTVDALETLFESLASHPYSSSAASSLDIVCWVETGGMEKQVGTSMDAARACRKGYAASVTIEFGSFELSIGPDHEDECLSNVPHIVFSEHVHPFRVPSTEDVDQGFHRRRFQFVSVLAYAAELLDPNWGFGRWGNLAVDSDSTVRELATSNAPPLYEYNVFDSQTVETIGRDRVLSAPAWFVEELDSGGVFLAVREPPKQCNSSLAPCVEVADHLGIPIARTERTTEYRERMGST